MCLFYSNFSFRVPQSPELVVVSLSPLEELGQRKRPATTTSPIRDSASPQAFIVLSSGSSEEDKESASSSKPPKRSAKRTRVLAANLQMNASVEALRKSK